MLISYVDQTSFNFVFCAFCLKAVFREKTFMLGDLGKKTCVNICEEMVLEGILYHSLQLYFNLSARTGLSYCHLTYIVPLLSEWWISISTLVFDEYWVWTFKKVMNSSLCLQHLAKSLFTESVELCGLLIL